MAGPTGFPLNQSTYIPGGPLVINGTAVGSNNLISFQLNGAEVANLNQSGVLSTAGGWRHCQLRRRSAVRRAAAGASVAGTVATLQPADGTHGGGVTTSTQTFAGVKTFSSVPVAAGLSAPASTSLALNGTSASKPISFQASTTEVAYIGYDVYSQPGYFIEDGSFVVSSNAGWALS